MVKESEGILETAAAADPPVPEQITDQDAARGARPGSAGFPQRRAAGRCGRVLLQGRSRDSGRADGNRDVAFEQGRKMLRERLAGVAQVVWNRPQTRGRTERMNRVQFGEGACERTRRYMDAYLSNELLVETNHDMLRHLETCAACSSELEMRTRSARPCEIRRARRGRSARVARAGPRTDPQAGIAPVGFWRPLRDGGRGGHHDWRRDLGRALRPRRFRG